MSKFIIMNLVQETVTYPGLKFHFSYCFVEKRLFITGVLEPSQIQKLDDLIVGITKVSSTGMHDAEPKEFDFGNPQSSTSLEVENGDRIAVYVNLGELTFTVGVDILQKAIRVNHQAL